MSAGFPHTSYSDVTSAKRLAAKTRRVSPLAHSSHRQRQDLLIELTDGLRAANRNG
ncbi:Uncharacterised protein [Mycolicibacterium gilvum]|uniref:Uncharacterized protein n=1 Tax=Mycolicibacterium gilvum TaxID=1804 RepID=A0A379MPJ5_9MYCO|nr:Uncharacterised protein [Mycolicibacterium gilvum]